MSTNRLLLCSDLDRTIIPNGHQPEHPEARERFRQLCSFPEVSLVYVTGRHQQLVRQAIEQYSLPTPDFAVTDVGTRVYRIISTEWHEMLDWQQQIATDWQGKTHTQLQETLSVFPQLVLQEQGKQNDFKLSYYVPLDVDRDEIFAGVESQLKQLGVAASLIWSVDEPEQVGLLDILPRNATKLHGIEFLQRQLGYSREELIFAGDSGNDLPVLASPIRSILVANAEQQIKLQARQLVKQNRCLETLYQARQDNFPLGGNYSAGVLQGVIFYVPELGAKLRLS